MKKPLDLEEVAVSNNKITANMSIRLPGIPLLSSHCSWKTALLIGTHTRTHTKQVIISKTTLYWCHSTVQVIYLFISLFLILFLSKPLEQNL